MSRCALIAPMQRRVEPEWLDELPPQDPGAAGSRRDLKRLNSMMGHVGLLARALAKAAKEHRLNRLVDLGAGDGTFALRVAKRIGPLDGHPSMLLLDKQESVSHETIQQFHELGWKAELAQCDVLQWLSEDSAPQTDVMFANLFLHHFEEPQLQALLHGAARRTRLFMACEPRRSTLALAASRLLGCVGCNAVTRHDAPISVIAGFRDAELSKVWPDAHRWRLEERRAGLFSHFFKAVLQ